MFEDAERECTELKVKKEKLQADLDFCKDTIKELQPENKRLNKMHDVLESDIALLKIENKKLRSFL